MKKLLIIIIDFFLSLFPMVSKGHIDTIYKPEAFRNLIEIERSRVLRSERPFSLLLFTVPLNKMNSESINKLIKKITARVRRIDQIGWFDHQHLGVLLPNTPKEGAKVIADEIFTSVKAEQFSIVYETLTYPDIDERL